WPSPPTATPPRWRTARIVVERNRGTASSFGARPRYAPQHGDSGVPPLTDGEGPRPRAVRQAHPLHNIREAWPAFHAGREPPNPADLEGKFKELGKEKFFAEWARQRIKELGVNGVYVLVCKSPARLEAEVTENTRKKDFTLADRDRLVKKMAERFREKKFDEG